MPGTAAKDRSPYLHWRRQAGSVAPGGSGIAQAPAPQRSRRKNHSRRHRRRKIAVPRLEPIAMCELESLHSRPAAPARSYRNLAAPASTFAAAHERSQLPASTPATATLPPFPDAPTVKGDPASHHHRRTSRPAAHSILTASFRRQYRYVDTTSAPFMHIRRSRPNSTPTGASRTQGLRTLSPPPSRRIVIKCKLDAAAI